MREWAIWLSVLSIALPELRYCYLTLKGKVKPVLAAWLIIAGTLTLSLATYSKTPTPSLVDNIVNTIGVPTTWLVVLSIYLRRRRDGDLAVAFSRFQKWSLAAAGGIVVFWVFAGAILANLAVQVLLVLSTVVNLQNLWRADENTESFALWIGLVIGSLFGIYPPVVKGNWLAMVFGIRSAICAILIVAFMVRVERRAGR